MNDEQIETLCRILQKIVYALEPSGYYDPSMSGLSDIDSAQIREMIKSLKEKKCPTCQSELEQTPDNPHYWMCYKCIKGYTTEELKE